MSLHHQADQSYRIPRRAQAARIQAQTQELLHAGTLAPAKLLDAPGTLRGEDGPFPVDIVTGTSQPVAMAYPGKVGVLIFGSATKPGGGWLNGAKAQEEDLSLASTWGTQAALAPAGFYEQQPGLGGLGPDKVLLAEGLWLATPKGAPLTTPQSVVFAGVAAPNLGNPETAQLPRSTVVDHLARRLAGALLGWEVAGVSCAVMGAIGCGVFQWQGEDSARALRKALNHYQAVGQGTMQVVLAMPDPKLAASFQSVLHAPANRRPAPRP